MSELLPHRRPAAIRHRPFAGAVLLLAAILCAACSSSSNSQPTAAPVATEAESRGLSTPHPSPTTPAPEGWQIETVTGNGSRGTADGGKGVAQLDHPVGVVLGVDGDLLVIERGGRLVRVSRSGLTTTLVEEVADGGGGVTGFALAGDGSIFVGDDSGRVWKLVDGRSQPFASFPEQPVRGIALGPDSAVLVSAGNMIMRLDAAGNVADSIGSSEAGFNDGPWGQARFWEPTGLAVDAAENIYVADRRNNRIRKILPTGSVTTLAGSGEYGFEDGNSLAAKFAYPAGVALSPDATVLVADTGNHAVRIITPEAMTATLAGGQLYGLQDGRGAAAKLFFPYGLAVAGDDAVYIADEFNSAVRFLSRSGGDSYAVKATEHSALPGGFLAYVATQAYYEVLFTDGSLRNADYGLPAEFGPERFVAVTRSIGTARPGEAFFQIFVDGPGTRDRQVSHLAKQPICASTNDGKTVYFTHLDEAGVSKIDTSSGAVIMVSRDVPAGSCGTLSSDGLYLYFKTPLEGSVGHYRVIRVAPGDGSTEVVAGGGDLTGDSRSFPDVVMPSPADSSLVLMGQPTAGILDTTSGRFTALPVLTGYHQWAWSPSGGLVLATAQQFLLTAISTFDAGSGRAEQFAEISAAREAALETIPDNR